MADNTSMDATTPAVEQTSTNAARPESRPAASDNTALDAKIDLRNTKYFPEFNMLPLYNLVDDVFYSFNAKDQTVPNFHWCLFGTIIRHEFLHFPFVLIKDKAGQEVWILFYHGDDQHIDLDSLQPGHTIAVLYAQRKTFIDRTHGVGHDDADGVQTLPMSLADIHTTSDRANAAKADEAGKHPCGNCGAKPAAAKRCAACNFVHYCNKECQAAAWAAGHKEECKKMRKLAGFLRMDWEDWEDYKVCPL